MNMSRDVLLSFAMGYDMKLKYRCVWSLGDAGEIKIISLDHVPSLKDNIYIHVCHTKLDVEADATIEELHKAVENYTCAGYL